MNVEICRFRLCKELEWTHGLLPKEETSVEEEEDVLTKFWDNFDLIVEVFWSSDECIEIKYNWNDRYVRFFVFKKDFISGSEFWA